MDTIETIYLETDEEITSVIDKLSKTKSDKVDIVVPKRATLTQSIVNLKLLKRQSEILKKKIAIITSDEIGRSISKKAGLNTKSSVKSEIEKGEFGATPEQLEDIEEIELENKRKIKPEENIKEKSDNMPGSFDFKMGTIGPDDLDKAKMSDEDTYNTLIPELIQRVKKEKQVESLGKETKTVSDKRQVTKFFRSSRGNKVNLMPSVKLKSFIAFFAISIVVVGIILFLVLPKAEITVVPRTEPFSNSFEMTIDTSVSAADLERTLIPGEAIEIETVSDKMSFGATGEKDVGEKARGEVNIYNNYSSDPFTLVENTRLMTEDKIFVTTQEVVVPGAKIEGGNPVAGQVKVRVESEVAGEESNIGPSSFNILNISEDKQSDIYGTSTGDIDGGISKKVKVVSQEDYDKAKEELTKSTESKIMDIVKNEIGTGKIFAFGAAKKEVIEVNSSSDIDQEVDNFDMDIKVKITGLAFSDTDLATILSNKFQEIIPKEKYIVNNAVSEGISFESLENPLSDDNQAKIRVIIAKQVAWKLDEKDIKDRVGSMDEGHVRDTLKKDVNIIDAHVEFWPFWVRKVPKSEKKIGITLDTLSIIDKLDSN